MSKGWENDPIVSSHPSSLEREKGLKDNWFIELHLNLFKIEYP